MSANILPCPFCGTDALIQEHEAHSHAGGIAAFMPDYSGSFTIECASSSCNCGMIHDTREQVVAAWNRRAALAAKTEGAALDLSSLTRYSTCAVRRPSNKYGGEAIGSTLLPDAQGNAYLVADVRALIASAKAVPAVQQGGEAVAYRMEMKPGDYSFMDAKHWSYYKKMYLGARVHELTLGRLIYEPDQDEETLLLFPSIVESRLDSAPHPVMDDKSGEQKS